MNRKRNAMDVVDMIADGMEKKPKVVMVRIDDGVAYVYLRTCVHTYIRRQLGAFVRFCRLPYFDGKEVRARLVLSQVRRSAEEAAVSFIRDRAFRFTFVCLGFDSHGQR